MRNVMLVGGGITGIGKIPILGVKEKGIAKTIRDIFRNGEQGFAYDPNDLTTLFQDAAGTVPVTSAGQPVGLMLDKSKGLVVGVELISNGTFETATGWTPTAGMSISNGTLNSNSTSNSSASIPLLSTIKAGSLVEVSYNLKSYTSGDPRVFFTGGNKYLDKTTGKKTIRLLISSDSSTLYFYSGFIGTGGVWSIDDVSVKVLQGNHAYQTTSASRPILRQNATTGAYYLEFDGVDDRLVTGSFPSMGSATTIFAGSYCSKALTAAIAARGAVGYLYQTSGTVAVQSVNNLITLLQSGNTVITAKYAASGTGVTIKANNLSSTNINTAERGFMVSNPLIVGAFDSNGLAPFLGHIYSLIGVSRLTTNAESIVIEREIAKRLGVTLSV